MHQLLCADLLTTFGYGQILPLLSLSLLHRGIGLPMIALGANLLLASSFLLGLPAGLFADAFGCKTALICGAILQALAAWGQVTAFTAERLCLASLVGGLSLALFSSAKVPLLSQCVPPAQLSVAIARIRAAGNIGSAIGGAMGAWLCWQTGDTTALMTGAAFVSLAIVPLLRLPRYRRVVHTGLPRLRVASMRPILRFALCCFLAAVGYSLLTPYISVLLSQRGFSTSSISASFSIWQLLALAVWPVTRWLARAGGQPLPAALLVLCGTTLLLGAPVARSWWWGAWLIWQAALNLVQCLLTASMAQASHRAVSFAGLSMLLTVAAIIGTQAGSLLVTRPIWLYLTAAGSCLLAYLASPRLKGRARGG